jgi:hypothetical protein
MVTVILKENSINYMCATVCTGNSSNTYRGYVKQNAINNVIFV